jgi:hypothetical protein
MAVSEFDFGLFFVFVSPPSSASVAPRAYRARSRAEQVGPPHATAVTTMSYGPTLVVHPELHTSGFGNQLGMLLQHLSIAALSHVQLVVPPLHVPVEHRQAPAFAEVLHADEVFNFSALSPLVNVTAFRRVPWLRWMAQHQEVVGNKMRVFAPLLESRSARLGESWTSPPIARVSLSTGRADLTMIEVLRTNRSGLGTVASDWSRQAWGYCHTVACRGHTRRAAKRECQRHTKMRHSRHGCSGTGRKYVRLGNNYYFARKLPWLLCATGAASADGASNPATARRNMEDGVRTALGDGAPSASYVDELLSATEREMLSRLELSGELRSAAGEIAASLGAYACVHVRLRDDEADSASEGAASKGLDKAFLLSALRELAPRLHARGARTVYVASNRPGAMRAMRADLEAAVATTTSNHASAQIGEIGSRPLQLSTWHDVLLRGVVPTGLRAALIEHEICATAPKGFAGSQFSTWSNLIGARRWLAGWPEAYVDLTSGAVVPNCGSLGVRLAAGSPQRGAGTSTTRTSP